MLEHTDKDKLKSDLKAVYDIILKDGADPVKQLSGYI